MKTALKRVAPLLATLCLGLAHTGTTIAATDSPGAAQQSDSKPDCKKTPDDPRCRKY